MVRTLGLAAASCCLLGTMPPLAAAPQPAAQSKQAETPPVPTFPGQLPSPMDPDLSGILGLYPDPDDTVGIGHLRPLDLSPLGDRRSRLLEEANWLRSVALPIYVEPAGPHWGWIVNGWLLSEGYPPIAIGRDAAFSMLHTYDDMFTFPVLEMRPDGWFRFQYTPAGSAWAHLSQLGLGGIELTVESWEDHFARVAYVNYRRHGLSQPLRSQPGGSESLLSLVGPNSLIEPLEFDGSWMRVRVVQPTEACEPLPGAISTEGWMRWRNSNQAPLVWHSPTDC